MRRYWFPKHYADEVQRLRVPCGFLLLAAFALFSIPSRGSLLVGLPVSFLGVLLRAWAAGNLSKNEVLATEGPFAWVRNPLYLGTLTAALGMVIASRQPSLALLFGAVFLLIYFPTVELEEQHLRKLFPQYAAYAEAVPILLPGRKPYGPTARFRMSLYMRNQEYQALLAFALAAAFLIWRAGLTVDLLS